MTGRIHYTPEAQQHLQDLDDWISEAASGDVASAFVRSILDHVDGILAFPHAGRAREDLRPGMRTTTHGKRTLIAYEVDESGPEVVVNVLGVFHGGRDWETAISEA